MDEKFERLYQKNPEAPAFALTEHFDNRQEMSAYIDYVMARKRGISHAKAMEKLAELQPERQKEAQFFAKRELSHEEKQSIVRARSLRESATGGPTSV